VQPGQDFHEGRFARTVIADHPKYLAGEKLQIHISQRGYGAEILEYTARLQQRFSGVFLSALVIVPTAPDRFLRSALRFAIATAGAHCWVSY
jgi:hypothetical protein